MQFEDSRDAEDAIRGRDGYNFDGCHLRVIRPSILIHLDSSIICWLDCYLVCSRLSLPMGVEGNHLHLIVAVVMVVVVVLGVVVLLLLLHVALNIEAHLMERLLMSFFV